MSAAPVKTSFASRNPGKEVIAARGRKKGEPLSTTEKKEAKARHAERLSRRDELTQEIEAFYVYRTDKVTDLATRFDHTPEYIMSLLVSETNFKQTRDISLRNAVMHRIKNTQHIGQFCFFRSFHRRDLIFFRDAR